MNGQKRLAVSSVAAASLLLAGCDTPTTESVTPPKDGVPTHIPALAPQVEAMQRAQAL